MNKRQAIKLAGSPGKLGEILGISRQAICKWSDKIPPLQIYRLREKKPEWFIKKPRMAAPKKVGAREDSCPV